MKISVAGFSTKDGTNQLFNDRVSRGLELRI